MTPEHTILLVEDSPEDREATIRAVRRAVEFGYPARFIAQEDEFAWLAGDAEMAAILATPARTSSR